MISTGVAEADPAHAATLLRFSLHLLQATQEVRGPQPGGQRAQRAERPVRSRPPPRMPAALEAYYSPHPLLPLLCPHARVARPGPQLRPPTLACSSLPLHPQIRLPGQQPLDLVMALASGHASSGLLGSTRWVGDCHQAWERRRRRAPAAARPLPLQLASACRRRRPPPHPPTLPRPHHAA